MKADTHPTYHNDAKVTCACGNTFTIGSTEEKMEIEVCSNCHPFYTGDMGTKKAAGRVEKFKARRAAAQDSVKSKREKKAEKRAAKASKDARAGKREEEA